MILITGGAGFIGSNLLAALEARGAHELVVCDRLGSGDKWRNIAKREIAALVAPEDLAAFLADAPDRLEAVFHMGAVSSTTETDADLIAHSNFSLSSRLWELCAARDIRLIYASSAATYGDGGAGFDDDGSIEGLARLRPLNAYGWSKHVFDRQVARMVTEDRHRPAQWVGLKFFNVYGPNEYHKGSMKSVVAQIFPKAQAGEPAVLFKSHNPDFADGGQSRDFVWVGDCVDVMLWLWDNPEVSGLFNMGSGKARSFADLATATFAALGREAKITYVDTPPEIREKYQYFTEARMDRLRAAGYTAPFTELEDGIARYVQGYLAADDPYL
ncbi:MAG: ADP-glyceromanno-heptose 6-epimerase [Alphaproteobacteria bacterium]|nr:ADP-glyceromanno-heptose 6-epimerase [Alphaproteobacteria bacterium]